jgi:hypothetical protein
MSSAPLAQHAADQIAKTIQRGAHLAAITDVDAFSALGNFFGTDAFGAIPVFQQFLADGNLADFEPDADGNGGYAALSGLNSYATGNIAGIDGFSTLGATSITDIDAFSALGATKPSDIDAFSALPNIQNFLTNGDLSRATGLSGIDAFSALPTYNAVAQGDIGALAPDSTGAGGIAAFSAIPAYLGIPPTEPAPDFPSTGTSPLLVAAKETPKVESTTTEVPSGGSNLVKSFVADLPKQRALTPVDPAPADSTPLPVDKTSNKQNQVRNGLSFKPEGLGTPLFLTGGGAGVDNGMPGWQKGLKSLGIGGGDSTGSESKGADAGGAK